MNATIGELTELYESDAIPVRGFGIVAGLLKTGSSECPPGLRGVLIKHIWQQIPKDQKINPNSFINSKDTAVVEITGVIPSIAAVGQYFDLKVTALPDTQTTSLAGGALLATDLKATARFFRFDQYMKTLAMAQGPVFIDKLDSSNSDEKSGYVLGGGVVTEGVQVALVLGQPDYLTANNIRNRLNERFGPNTANAISPSEIRVTIPGKFKEQKTRFLMMVNLLYLDGNPELAQKRTDALVRKLINDDDKLTSELALEVMGNFAINKLAPLLEAKDQTVSFHAARCMLNIGDDRGLRKLRQIATDNNSSYRIGAIRTIGTGAKRNDAVSILAGLLGDNDFDVRFAAYDQLRKLEDISISQMLVRDFWVDSVIRRGPKTIFVSRATFPRIVLFGAPIYCQEDIFIESPKRDIIINARPGEEFVSITRKHPRRPNLIGPWKTSFQLTDIIRTLGSEPDVKGKLSSKPGMGISYAEIIALLEQMCKNGAIQAEFRAGPISEAGVNLEKKRVTTDNNSVQ